MGSTEIDTKVLSLPEKLLYEMIRIRKVEERIAELYGEGEMRCPVHLSIGQEAIAVGVCNALEAEDHVFSTHRCHAHYLAKRGCLKSMLAEIYGKATGCCKGKGGSMHLIDLKNGFMGAAPIVGSTIPISVGAAFGDSFRKGNKRITVAFFGDGATEEGVFHESLGFAALKKLPILFVCENNFFSVYSPLSVRQAEGHRISSLAAAHGLKVYTGDGNDVLGVHEMAREAAAHVRNGLGPAFIELSTYRWREHCGPNCDDHLGYRLSGELEKWKENCPIKRLSEHLTEGNVQKLAAFASWQTDIDREIDESIAFAKASPFPEQSELFTEVFAS